MEATDQPTDRQKAFRINNTKLFLTYKEHLDKEKYRKWISEKLKVYSLHKCLIGHEKGETDYDHTHIVIATQRPISTANCRYFDYEGIHPNISKITTTKSYVEAQLYTCKEDPELQDLRDTILVHTKEIRHLWNASEFLDMVSEGVDPLRAQVLWQHKTDNIKIDNIEWKDWYGHICDEIKNQTTREITWYCDKVGGAGKTQFCRYYIATEPRQFTVVKGNMMSRDFNTVINNAVNNGWDGYCLLIDLPRTCDQQISIYQNMESVKDGIITTSKYSGTTRIFEQSKVVVFANWFPKVELLSMDRWRVYELVEGVPVRVTLEYLAGTQLPENHDGY